MIPYKKFKDFIIKTQYGFTAEKTSTEGTYKYLRITDIVPYFVDYSRVPYCEIPDKKVSQYLVHENDILIARTGATTGYNYFVPKNIKNTVFASYLIRFFVDYTRISPGFLKYCLKSPSYYGFINNYVGGSAQPGMNARVFGRYVLPYPDRKIQDKIADILSSYDSLIEINSKRIKTLERMAEGIYKEWFVRFRFPGFEKSLFVNGLPKDWIFLKLENFGVLLDTGSRPSGGIDSSLTEGMPSLGAEAIGNLGEFDYKGVRLISFDFYSKMKRGKNTNNDILLYKDGAYIGKVTLFRDGFPYQEYAINEHVFFIRAKNPDLQNYLYFTLHQEAMFSLMQNLNRNAAQPGLSRKDISGIKIVVPCSTVIKQFNEKVEPILKAIFNFAHQNSLLIRQRDSLLPRLISGKLEVKG